MHLKRLFVFTLVLFNFSQLLALSDTEKCIVIAKSYCSGIKSIQKKRPLTFRLKNGTNVRCSDNDNYDLWNRDDYLKQINNVDLSDILDQAYPYTNSFTTPLNNEVYASNIGVPITDLNMSPGRFRNDALLMATYGSNSREVESNIVTINFLGKNVRFNKQNGAADALRKVSREITKKGLAKSFWRFRNKTGSVSFRKISGTNRISAHSYGMTIDFTIKKSSENHKSQYWKWNPQCRTDIENDKCFDLNGSGFSHLTGISRLSEKFLDVVIPDQIDNFVVAGEAYELEVVSIFEKHGFIWGGKWYHYDTMHFEYRPEFFGGHNRCKHIVRQIPR